MSQANFSAIHGPYRRKVTLACGSCRRRRVKCSGTQPCTLCSESGRLCEFDSVNRGRRGPRPKQPAGQAERVIRPLAPRRPSSEHVQVAPVIPLPGVAAEPAWRPPELQAAGENGLQISDGSDEDDDESGGSGDEGSMPDPSMWKPGLEKLIYGENSISDTLPGLDIHLMCHLLEMFCSRSNAQLRPLLSPVHIQQHLSQGIISRALILAVCASSVRFTVHRNARGPQARHFAEVMAQEARKSIQVSKVGWKQVDSVKATCVLVDYEASRGHGRQAWVDIAMARGLVQLSRSNCNLDVEQTQALDAAERYLAIAQISHCLGHPGLKPPPDRPAKKPKLEAQCASCPSDRPHLVELLEVLACIHELCSTPFKEQHPPPWAPESRFRALQDELEQYLLRHPDTFHFGSTSSPLHDGQSDLDASISSLIWHSCAIVLNRTFLPIPERPKPSAGGECETALIPCVQFPGAPPLFLKERIYRCESSAGAICEISRNVIRSGNFYSHALLVGLACTQSALVCINRLHRSSKPYDDRIVENLKICFVSLGALKPIYAPAEGWMDALFRAYYMDTRLTHASETVDVAFNSYFSRFLDIDEPVFMPLDPNDSYTSEDAEGSHQRNGVPEQSSNGISAESRAQDQSSALDAGPEWLQAYAGHLSGDIEEGDDVETNDNTSCYTAIHAEPVQTGTVAQEIPDPNINTGKVQEATNTAPSDAESPVAIVGAIPTPRGGRVPDTTIKVQDTQPEHPSQGDVVRDSTTVHVGDAFSELYGPMVSFSDVAGLDLEMPMFPGLGPAIGGPDIWSDLFNQDMIR